jgi:hypothetical protein
MNEANMVCLAGLIGALLFVVPAAAWIVWWRRPRPRPRALLIVPIAASAPVATGLAATLAIGLMVRAWKTDDKVEPSDKARLLAEHISEAMNVTAFVLLVAGVVAAGALIIGRATRKPPSSTS